jgi:hypothetical protein
MYNNLEITTLTLTDNFTAVPNWCHAQAVGWTAEKLGVKRCFSSPEHQC